MASRNKIQMLSNVPIYPSYIYIDKLLFCQQPSKPVLSHLNYHPSPKNFQVLASTARLVSIPAWALSPCALPGPPEATQRPHAELMKEQQISWSKAPIGAPEVVQVLPSPIGWLFMNIYEIGGALGKLTNNVNWKFNHGIHDSAQPRKIDSGWQEATKWTVSC